MKKILVTAMVFMLPVTGALAQSTASQTTPGYLTTSGCLSGQTVCFKQYGASIPTTPGASDQPVSIDQTTPGTTNGVQTNAGSVTNTTPAQRTKITLDVKTVTTGGTAVTAVAAGHATAGGFLQNPPSATINLCINEIGVASGTTSSGDTTCIVPGQSYNITPGAGAVSVISSDSAHPFSGYGLN